jgi:hypothetical protein
MRRATVRRTLASLALLAALALPASAGASTAHGAPTAKRTLHPRVYGTLMDAHPSTDARLDVYTKTHRAHHYVYMTGATVVKIHTQVVHRNRLKRGLYVIVTCLRRRNGDLQALTVHIEFRHPRKKKTTTS